MQKLIKKIVNRKANAGIIGIGYEGIPLVTRFAE
jgi:UDP-N-acetyl-D-mannosaminuronate dehydrogenase